MMKKWISAFAMLSTLGIAMVIVGVAGTAHAQDSGDASGDKVELKPVTLGDEDAPARIDEYASLTCSHCAKFHNSVLPKLKEKYIDTGKVRLVVHAYPLNKPALDASMLVQCMPDERTKSFMSLLFENQKKWAQKEGYKQALKQNARLAGMADERAEKCLGNEELRQAIVSNMQQASKQLDISSTPTFILNDGADRIVGARSIDVFAEKIDKLIDDAGTANNDNDED